MLSLPRRGRVGPKGRGGASLTAQCAVNRFQNAAQISIHICVPEPQNFEPLLLKMSVTFTILRRVLIEVVLSAIDFDDQPLSETDEIKNVTVAWRLSAKVIAAMFPGAQMHPQLHLLPRH